MKQLFKKPSYYLISSAMDGNEKAIEKLLAFYDPYISKSCGESVLLSYKSRWQSRKEGDIKSCSAKNCLFFWF